MSMNRSEQAESFQLSADPFIRLLECYVLWAIRLLPEKQAEILEQLAPKFRKTFGKEGSWQQVISAHMEFPPDMVEQLTVLWEKNRTLAAKNGENLRPDDFARLFVSKNFGSV